MVGQLEHPEDFFKRLCNLAEKKMDPLVDFFLFEGVPFAMREFQEYCQFRRELSDRLSVNTKSIVLVGSGRFGYSLSPDISPRLREPKLWRSFNDQSDFDVVVVDHRRFEEAWLEILQNDGPTTTQDPHQLTQRWRNVYDGIINFDYVPDTPFVGKWQRAFADVSAMIWDGKARTTKGFLFREWYHAQRFYAKSFRQILSGVKAKRLPTPPEKPRV